MLLFASALGILLFSRIKEPRTLWLLRGYLFLVSLAWFVNRFAILPITSKLVDALVGAKNKQVDWLLARAKFHARIKSPRTEALSRQLAEIQALGQQKAFESAQSQFERDRAARESGERLGLSAAESATQQAQSLAALGDRARAGDVQAAQLLEQIGKDAQATDQAGLDLAYEDFVRQRDFPKENWQTQYVPHGIDEKKFFPIVNDFEFEVFKEKFFEGKEYDFVVFWNNRNIRRKNPGDVITSWRIFTNQLPKEQAERCLLIMHTDKVDANGTDIPAIIETMCDPEVNKVKFTDGKCDEKTLNYYYNLADAQYMMTDNEGWGLSLTEGLMAGNMIIAPVQGGMQDQMRFEDENKDWINFTTEFPTNSNGRYKKCGEWAIPMFAKTRSVKGSPQTPYIYATQVDIEDAGLALLKCYNLGKEEINRRGLKGREWLLSEEAKMTAAHMGQNFIDNINILFENWEPVDKFTIDKVEDKKSTYNPNAVQYTPEFKQKLKEVLS